MRTAARVKAELRAICAVFVFVASVASSTPTEAQSTTPSAPRPEAVQPLQKGKKNNFEIFEATRRSSFTV